ncbi:NAD(P)-binding protein [Calocera viscosa TUFC12733]|uniref:NAD(P)-binding protein n=1 Tax=Calocera viscosa (strain TUFC12733) TaxID=1330018 RepID=A0A167LB24_CALVF|nr:NAD(P)-binding protein [Calocera viscosa TUFC12733]
MASLLKKIPHPGGPKEESTEQSSHPVISGTNGTPNLPLYGKSALITGSSRNIGRAIALRLADAGADVVINYTANKEAADETVEYINLRGVGKAVAIQSNVSSVTAANKLVTETVAAFKKIDILVLNAGIMGNKPIADVDEEYYDAHFNINAKGPFFVTKFAVPYIPSGGRIIFFSTHLTVQSLITPNYVVYAATKGAIEQFSRVLAKDLGTKGITVNTVSPGPTATSLFFAGKSQELIDKFKGFSPFNRLGEPEDIAGTVLFLAGPDAVWVSGQNIKVAGVSSSFCICRIAWSDKSYRQPPSNPQLQAESG